MARPNGAASNGSGGSRHWRRLLLTRQRSHRRNGNMADITDRGRQTTLNLGRRLRHPDVHGLGFLPETIRDANMVYLRSSSLPRALDSLQQVFTGLYPPEKRDGAFQRPTIVTRRPEDETVMPNEDFCESFIQLAKAFSRRTADKYNQSSDMDYVNNLLQKWMPSQQHVAVDSTPKLHGIWDTINSTLATPGPPTRLPPEFYDAKARGIIDRIVTEEEYAGFKESNEYRTVGIRALLQEVVERMVRTAPTSSSLQISPQEEKGAGTAGDLPSSGTDPKIALFGCHDSTLAAILASLGALEGENNTWPSYTYSLAIELFQANTEPQTPTHREHTPMPLTNEGPQQYVRIRYNDSPITILGCRPPGRHLAGDKSFCNLEAFKEIVDKFSPKDWKKACGENLDKPAFPTRDEPAGY